MILVSIQNLSSIRTLNDTIHLQAKAQVKAQVKAQGKVPKESV
jgi:hypothetical protein